MPQQPRTVRWTDEVGLADGASACADERHLLYLYNILYSRVLYVVFIYFFVYIRDDNAGSGSELVIRSSRYYHRHRHRHHRHYYYYKRLLDVIICIFICIYI